MRKIREILRLRHAGLSCRQIAASLKLSRTAVNKYLTLARQAELVWPLPHDLDDVALSRILLGDEAPSSGRFAVPDFASIHTELKRKGVTLLLLWQEYQLEHPDHAYQYTQFTVLYKQWLSRQKLSCRQIHRAGEKLFVDFSGKTLPVLDPVLGTRMAEIFVAVLGASRYTYVEAVWTQSLPDFITAHVHAFEFFGGAPSLIVPDCLKSAVVRSCWYEPDLNRTYEEMARHYHSAILPARPRHPKDKSAVELGVLVVQRWILARLRNRTFESLSHLNRAIAGLLDDLNRRPFKKLPGSRRSLFEALDNPALAPLPDEPYRFARWGSARVGIDYHVVWDNHHYSVPFSLVRRTVDIRASSGVVEIFHRNIRVASHPRSGRVGDYTTLPEHMPASHRAHREWTPNSLLAWGASIGASCRSVVDRMLVTRPHPEHGYRACLGLQRLGRRFGADRLEAACARALAAGSPAYRSIESILSLGLDRIPMIGSEESTELTLAHANIRGAAYYQDLETRKDEPLC